MFVRGTVLSHDGHLARVRICHGEYCGGCGHHSADQTQVELDATDPVGVRAGQRVELRNDPVRMLRMMLFVFWFPLLAAALGAWGGDVLAARVGASSAVLATLAGVLALAAAALAVRAVGQRTRPGTGLVVTRVIPDGETCAVPQESIG